MINKTKDFAQIQLHNFNFLLQNLHVDFNFADIMISYSKIKKTSLKKNQAKKIAFFY